MPLGVCHGFEGKGMDKKKSFKVKKIGSPHCVFWDFVH